MPQLQSGSVPAPLHDFKLDRTVRLLLHDVRSGHDVASLGDVCHMHADEITGAQLYPN
jgi:hypothetical protein